MDWGGWEMSELLNKAKILFNKGIVSVALRAEVGERGGLVCVAECVGCECGFQAECDLGQALRFPRLLKA